VSASIRPARPDDAPALQAIELRAGERFREVGMDAIADAEPDSLDLLADSARSGHMWVAVDLNDEPLGYVRADEVDGQAHIDQVSVTPEAQGRGLARALLDTVRMWAVATGKQAITLTTFKAVPWNAPLYEHLGFRELAGPEIGPELLAICDAEASLGLDPETHSCMGLRVGPGTSFLS
jgi:GNAT superfamily N-acetyltransferase